MRFVWIVLLCLLAAAGCEAGKEAKESGKSAGSTAETGAGGTGPAGAPAQAEVGDESPAAAWAKDPTMDCPTHVGTANATIEDLPDGWAVVVTSADASDVERIRRHAAYVAGAAEHIDPPSDALRFGGVTGDRNNNCAVILDGTRVTTQDIDGGARLEVRPTDAARLEALRTQAKQSLEIVQMMKQPPP